MDNVLKKKTPAKKFFFTRCAEKRTATQKVSALIRKDNLPKDVDLFQILIKASEKEPIKLEIPETLVRDEDTLEPVCLYTDKDGLICITKGENAQRHFYYLSRERRRSSNKTNPHIHSFPKYICFESGKSACTLDRSTDLRAYMMGKWERVQRYIVSEGFRAQKMTVHWRETKISKAYSVKSIIGCPWKRNMEMMNTDDTSKSTSADSMTPCPYSLETQSFDVSLDNTFVASLSNLHSCKVRKERTCPHISEVLSPLLRRLLSTYSLCPDEHLQEFVYSIQKSQDGHWILLNCARAKARTAEDSFFVERNARHRQTRSIQELSLKLFSADKHTRTTSFALPMIAIRDEDFCTVPRHVSVPELNMKSCPHSVASSSSLISHYIGNIAGKLDDLRHQGHVQREVNARKNIMKFKHHPPGFLENVIKKVYDFIMKDPKLTRYYRNKDQIRGQVESAVRHVIVNGITKLRLRDVHSHLYITDSTFDRYVSYFMTALRTEGVKSDEITSAQAYFEAFREDVVTVQCSEIEEINSN